jgi:catechol 2,3-dioxygenase-like lactoylglutathione lyase family enzyme
MSVIGINHVNIRTMDVAASTKFYVDVFNFEFRQGPVVNGHQANWLCDKSGRAIIHFRILEAESSSTGPIDHVALDCEEQSQILERLKALDIRFAVVEDLLPGVTQVFVKDPHGVPLELNFKNK